MYKNNIYYSNNIKKIFHNTKFLISKGLIMNVGKMIDASFTIAPRQRNTRD